MGIAKLLLLGAGTLVVTGAAVNSGSGGGCCLFPCEASKASPSPAVAAATPPSSTAEVSAPPVAGLRVYLDANGNLTSTPPPGTKALTRKSTEKPHLVFSHYLDPNDPSKGAVMRPVNFRTSSIATIGPDGKVSTKCVDASGHEMSGPEGHEEHDH